VPGYVINDMEVTDPVAFERYRQLSPPTVAQYGGRFLVRGGATRCLDGGWSPKRLVILEFASVEQATAWFDSPEYAPARALREQSARSNIIVTEGVGAPP
jgi:uncharacterized protein (DUF1330 family)